VRHVGLSATAELLVLVNCELMALPLSAMSLKVVLFIAIRYLLTEGAKLAD